MSRQEQSIKTTARQPVQIRGSAKDLIAAIANFERKQSSRRSRKRCASVCATPSSLEGLRARHRAGHRLSSPGTLSKQKSFDDQVNPSQLGSIDADVTHVARRGA